MYGLVQIYTIFFTYANMHYTRWTLWARNLHSN